jgi:hypothetical protein
MAQPVVQDDCSLTLTFSGGIPIAHKHNGGVVFYSAARTVQSDLYLPALQIPG